MAVDPEQLDFTLSLRSDFPSFAPTPRLYFHKFWRLDGVERSALTKRGRQAFDNACSVYVRGCKALQKDPEKRAQLARAHTAARKWDEHERRAGRAFGVARVPAAWMKAHGVNVDRVVRVVVPVARDRESRSPSSRREGARSGASRDGPLPRSEDEDDEPDVASRPRVGVAAWRRR
jgi:hypothetical protein